tara:strand:+ start:43 stop:168 length:126 start_codon:yes stop_codon:yes gene_type:complete
MDEELYKFIEDNVFEIDMDFEDEDISEEDKIILMLRNSTYQ